MNARLLLELVWHIIPDVIISSLSLLILLLSMETEERSDLGKRQFKYKNEIRSFDSISIGILVLKLIIDCEYYRPFLDSEGMFY